MGFLNKVVQQEAIQSLKQSGKEFKSLFQKGQLTVEIYKPNITDKQMPHDRDEFYLVISGEGKFKLLEQVTSFEPGDFLYVPAHAHHKFIEFTEDFVTWVFFIG